MAASSGHFVLLNPGGPDHVGIRGPDLEALAGGTMPDLGPEPLAGTLLAGAAAIFLFIAAIVWWLL